MIKLTALGMVLALVCGACASSKNYVVNEAVGPAPGQKIESAQNGILQVYSAREEADVDLNQQIFFWNNDFGKNDFMYEPAHTSYSIFTHNGLLYAHVRNALDQNDEVPTRVSIPAGSYTVEAQAEGGNVTTVKVIVPVTVKAGETTVVHLERDWKPSKHQAQENELVRAYDGRIIGWRAANP